MVLNGLDELSAKNLSMKNPESLINFGISWQEIPFLLYYRFVKTKILILKYFNISLPYMAKRLVLYGRTPIYGGISWT
jgi:hypothetical protein